MSENKNTISIQKSRGNILDILSTRGFNTEQYKGFSLTEIHALVINKQLDLLVENPTINKKVYIKYYLDKTIRPNNVHELIEDLFNLEQIVTKNDDLIIIIKDEPNDTLQKLQVSIFEHDKIFVTIINIERLQFNILNHVLVPPHRVLSIEEADAIRKKYEVVNNRNFPGISRFDPPAQVLGVRPGDLCEITRSSKTAITTKNYRFCSS